MPLSPRQQRRMAAKERRRYRRELRQAIATLAGMGKATSWDDPTRTTPLADMRALADDVRRFAAALIAPLNEL